MQSISSDFGESSKFVVSAGFVVDSNFVQGSQRSNVRDGDVEAAIRNAFGGQAEVVRQFKPYYLSGDFNGDGAPDLFAVVRLRGAKDRLPTDIIASNPFGYGEPQRKDAATHTRTRLPLAFAIIHGRRRGGWSAPDPQAKYLLLGASPILALQSERSGSGADEQLIELLPVSRRRERLRSFRKELMKAKGDAIIAATEAVDSLIYFDGKSYRWQEELEEL